MTACCDAAALVRPRAFHFGLGLGKGEPPGNPARRVEDAASGSTHRHGAVARRLDRAHEQVARVLDQADVCLRVALTTPPTTPPLAAGTLFAWMTSGEAGFPTSPPVLASVMLSPATLTVPAARPNTESRLPSAVMDVAVAVRGVARGDLGDVGPRAQIEVNPLIVGRGRQRPVRQNATFSSWALLPMLPPVAVRVRFLAPIEAPAEFVMSPVAVMLVPSSACSMSPVKVTGRPM